MKWLRNLIDKLTGLHDAVARFPLTTIFLLAAVIANGYMIQTETTDMKILLTLVLGAFLSAVFQVSYERFYTGFQKRLGFMAVSALLTAGYCYIIFKAPELSLEIEVKTAVAMLALLFAFIWVPVVKHNISFNKSFMIVFKSIFNALFFAGVIFGGISLILASISTLIIRVDPNAYEHTANIVFILFAPMYFFSLIPVYPRPEDLTQTMKPATSNDEIELAASSPKFLTVLISYILIPLLAVYTLIIVIYIALNIGGAFWSDSLLEPMLISYSITVLLLYILSSKHDNKFAFYFRKIFPKLLIPIVSFQMVSSFITLGNTGMTHTRYYVLLFGLFTIVSGILLSFLSVRKNGVIAPILIVFAVISIIPPVDAFTISKNSQVRILEEELVKNDMLKNNIITPKEKISDESKEKITNSIQYLSRLNYTDDLSYLPADFNLYDDFQDTFGFAEYRDPTKINDIPFTFIHVKQPVPIQITDYDYFIQINISPTYNNEDQTFSIKKANHQFSLLQTVTDNQTYLKLIDETNKELIVFNTEEIFEQFSGYRGENFISVDDAIFTKENDIAKLTVFVQDLSIQQGSNPPLKDAMVYVFVQIK